MSPGVQRCDSSVCGPVCSLDLIGTDLQNRTRFTMRRLDQLLSIIFYISSDVFANVGRVLSRVLTH